MIRKKIVIGNWKMNKTFSDACKDFSLLIDGLAKNQKNNVQVGVAAPALFLSDLSKVSNDSVFTYSQNIHDQDFGALTGEISVPMLKSMNSKMFAGSLVGHSERRVIFGENDEFIGRKIGTLLKHNLRAIFCVGETLAERESHQVEQVLEKQIRGAFQAANIINKNQFLDLKNNPHESRLVIAYEPVWAIGTGRNASAQDAQAAHQFIRHILETLLDKETAKLIPIIYGGSVKPDNVTNYFQENDIDGALVGGSSLKPEDFLSLIGKV